MSRIRLLAFVGALAALCPVSAGAQSGAAAAGGPRVLPATGPTPDFKFFAGSTIDDIARTINVPELLTRINLHDPALDISLGVSKDLAKRKGGSVVTAAPADYTVTVTSTEWSAGYYVPFRGTFNLRYSAKFSISNASGAVVKEGSCAVMPDDEDDAGGNDVLIAHGGRKLKEIYAKATQSCEREIISKMKSL